jgi:hypothetical protein
MHRFNIRPQLIETTKAICFDRGWKPKIKTMMADNADNGIEEVHNNHPDVKVFTDGSGMEGKIGAAAILYRNGSKKTMYQLGSQKHHMVYKGEGVGVILGTKLISKEWGIWSAIIYTDNQAAITATQLTNPIQAITSLMPYTTTSRHYERNTLACTSPSNGYWDIKELRAMNKQTNKQRRQ